MYTRCLKTLYGTIKIVFLGNSLCWSKMFSNNYKCLTFYRNKSEFLFECLVKYCFYFTIPSLRIFHLNYQLSLSHNHTSCVSEWAEHPVDLHSEWFHKHNQSNLKFLGKATICILVTTDFIYMRWCNDIDKGNARVVRLTKICQCRHVNECNRVTQKQRQSLVHFPAMIRSCGGDRKRASCFTWNRDCTLPFGNGLQAYQCRSLRHHRCYRSNTSCQVLSTSHHYIVSCWPMTCVYDCSFFKRRLYR